MHRVSTPRSPGRSLARQIFLLQALLVLLMVLIGLALASYDARARSRADARELTLTVARSMADSPTVVEAVTGPDPSAVLQPYAEQVRQDTGVDFVVVMRLDGIRYTHPRPELIGGHFAGPVGDAPKGIPFSEEYTGSLGPSVRSVVPVRQGEQVVALVAVGITIAHIEREIWGAVATITLAGAAVLAIGGAGVLLIARRLRRQTHGLSAPELTRMYEYHQAVLHAVREGLLLLDADHRVQLANEEARSLLQLPTDCQGRAIADLGLPPALVEAAVGERAQSDDLYVIGGNALVVSSAPARRDGRTVGAVVTVRDRTQLQAVSGELDVVRQLTDALRAQNHESANRLHTVVSLVEMGQPQEAIEFATEELQVAQLLTDTVVAQVGDPVLAALLLGKSAQAAERGVTLTVRGVVQADHLDVASRELVTLTAISSTTPSMPWPASRRPSSTSRCAGAPTPSS